MIQNQNQVSETVTGCISVLLQKGSPAYLGMPGKKREVWVKGRATSQHCIVPNKGQKGVGLILEEKKQFADCTHSWTLVGQQIYNVLTHTQCRTLTQFSLQSLFSVKLETNYRILFWHKSPKQPVLCHITHGFKTKKRISSELLTQSSQQHILLPQLTNTSESQPVLPKHCDLLMMCPPPLPQSQRSAGDIAYCRSPSFQNKFLYWHYKQE